MNKLSLLFLIFTLTSNSQTNYKKVNALFLGNSYTYVNNLPQLISSIALANNDTLTFDSNCPGGYTLNNHFTDATSISKINTSTWQYVVLQAQSQEPSFSPAQVNAQTLPYAIKLDSIIKHAHACATTVFYETWGRKNGDASNCLNYPPVCTYSGMQNRLRQSYKLFADTTSSILAPVGEAFKKTIAASPTIELYQADESHPSLEGSFLAASVFYEVLFQKSVLSNTYNPGLAPGSFSLLQQMGHEIVNDSLGIWNVGKYLPWADFSPSVNFSPVQQFSSHSANMTNKWYFGDGTTSGFANPSHTYVSSGTYTVTHVVKSANCKTDSISRVINIEGFIESNKEEFLKNDVKIYPNPCKNILIIEGVETFKERDAFIEIRNVFGQTLSKFELIKEIDVSELKNGIYFMLIHTKFGISNLRFVKNE